MAEDAAAAATCSHNKSKAVFLSAAVGHHANGLTKTAGSATFSNSKPGAAKKLVIKNFKGSTQKPWMGDPVVNRRLKVEHKLQTSPVGVRLLCFLELFSQPCCGQTCRDVFRTK